jgi:hypothetical protein
MIKKYSQNNKVQYAITKWLVDDVEDIKKLPPSPMGSSVFVIHTATSYMVDSTEKTWHPISSNGTSNGPIECDCVEELTIWEEMLEE